jgi:hypothetical protein
MDPTVGTCEGRFRENPTLLVSGSGVREA